ncbi:MAG: hypothetical protein O2815_04170 [Actinomycetota bacterium]|nr:hypothetical protein [Actinomycetota bacterium]
MSEVVAFTLNVKPGRYAEVLTRYAECTHKFAEIRPALVSHIVVGDEDAGIVRGIGARVKTHTYSYRRR